MDQAMDLGKEYGPMAAKAVGYAANPMSAVTDAARFVGENPQKAYEMGGPWMPAAGAALGSVMAPGLGTAAGAGLGEIARQGAGIVFNDPNSPRTARDAATSAMLQTGLGGVDKVNALFKSPSVSKAVTRIGDKGIETAKPYVERGIEAAGRAFAPVGEGIKKAASKFTEAMTGVPATRATKLIEEPSRLFSGIGQMKKLGEKVGEAESVSEAGLSPAMRAKITTNEKGAANKIVAKLLEKNYIKPDAITPLEATAGIKAIDATFPTRTERNSKIIQELSNLRTQLSEIQAKADPNLAAAKGAYADAKVGSSFRNLFRQTKSGKTSSVPFLLSGATLTGLSLEAAKKAMTAMPFLSPAVYGTALAGGSAATKGAASLATNSTARQALISRYIVGREGQDVNAR
jgi:hypothetical protein